MKIFNFYFIFSLHLDRTYASKYIPIIASVSEHQPPTWPSYFMDINVLAFLVPAGIIVSFKLSSHYGFSSASCVHKLHYYVCCLLAGVLLAFI